VHCLRRAKLITCNSSSPLLSQAASSARSRRHTARGTAGEGPLPSGDICSQYTRWMHAASAPPAAHGSVCKVDQSGRSCAFGQPASTTAAHTQSATALFRVLVDRARNAGGTQAGRQRTNAADGLWECQDFGICTHGQGSAVHEHFVILVARRDDFRQGLAIVVNYFEADQLPLW
jgi:hypothetical protein